MPRAPFTDRDIAMMRLSNLMFDVIRKEQLELQHELATFGFHDGVFAFWTAVINPQRRIIFRVRQDRHPNTRANEKGYHPRQYIRPSKDWEIRAWLRDHPDFPILAFVGVE